MSTNYKKWLDSTASNDNQVKVRKKHKISDNMFNYAKSLKREQFTKKRFVFSNSCLSEPQIDSLLLEKDCNNVAKIIQ